ncbi:MAG: hypothetical protein SF172_15440 [Burkholderiales bacterium]|nr:hypothetical protein [Burkholderiales bacterium]
MRPSRIPTHTAACLAGMGAGMGMAGRIVAAVGVRQTGMGYRTAHRLAPIPAGLRRAA